jgi:hypothetical protein
VCLFVLRAQVFGEDKIHYAFVARAQAGLQQVNPTAADTKESRYSLCHFTASHELGASFSGYAAGASD